MTQLLKRINKIRARTIDEATIFLDGYIRPRSPVIGAPRGAVVSEVSPLAVDLGPQLAPWGPRLENES